MQTLDYALQQCPNELAQVPALGICPEVRQIVQEAFAKHYKIHTDAVRARAIELGAMSSDVPSIFKNAAEQQGDIATGLGRRNARRIIKRTDRRQQNGPSVAPNMPGAYPADSSDSDAGWDTRSFEEGETDLLDLGGNLAAEETTSRVKTTGYLIEHNNHQNSGLDDRNFSDNSLNSALRSSIFSAADTASSRTSADVQSPRDERASEQVAIEQPKRIGPKRLIKNALGRNGHSTSPDTLECLACATEFPSKQLVVLGCPAKHTYCRACFQLLVGHSCENEASFPPQCCQVPVSTKLITTHATREARKKFEDLKKVVSIPADERWYCPYPKCAKAMNASKVTMTPKGARCPHCRRYICVSCKQAAHVRNSDCQDGALKATLLAGRDRGWQSCFRCGEMVELKDGCRHVTCRCKAEFCYICTRRWGSCIDGHACMQKLDDMRNEASRQAEQVETEQQVGPLDEPAMLPEAERATAAQRVIQSAAVGRFQRPQGRADQGEVYPTGLTEEEQIAYAMSESLRESEEAEMIRMIEESENAAAAVAAVIPLQERIEKEKEDVSRVRVANIGIRFHSFEEEMHQIKEFQEDLINGRAHQSPCSAPRQRVNDMQWLERMHAERLDILTQDRELLIWDPGFALEDYRRTAQGHEPYPSGTSAWEGDMPAQVNPHTSVPEYG